MSRDVAPFVVPAGKYFLGDPCYAVPNHLWMDLLEDADYFLTKHSGRIEIHHKHFVTVYAMPTMYGDGFYVDQNGSEFPVDAGLIGLTPFEAINLAEMEGQERSGCFVTFDKDTTCYSDSGNLYFGHICIPTCDVDYEQGEEDYE